MSGYAPADVPPDRQQRLAVAVDGLKRTVCSRCGKCDGLCSQGLPLSWIFWAGLLNVHPSVAFEQPPHIDYFRLHPRLESACAACADVTCVCPDGIDIRASLIEMHIRMRELMEQGLIAPPESVDHRRCGDAAFGARVVCIDVPRTMAPGREYRCRFHLENMGERGWLPDDNPHADEHRARVALGVFVGRDRMRTIEVTHDVHKGDRWHSSFDITAPRNVDRFHLRLQLLGEHQQFSELGGPVVFSEDIRVERAACASGDDTTDSAQERSRMELTLAELAAERNRLRAEVEAQRLQIALARDRVRDLEQLFHTISAGRAYRLLRRLGRWKWLDRTLAAPRTRGGWSCASAVDGSNGAGVLDPPVRREPAVESVRDWDLNPFFHPLDASYGYAGHLVDRGGRDLIDFSAAWGANILGYGYPRVAEAIADQARRFSGVGMRYPEFGELERLLCSVIPGADAVRYGKNGSDATMGAVRLARAITGRERVLHRGYHGFHDWWMASTGCPGVPRALTDLIEPLPQFTPDAVERALQRRCGEIACVIVDPMVPPMPGASAVRDIIEVAHRHGALVIFDEVVSGFRLAPGGMQEVWGVQPDLACYGKSVANGLPLSILSGTDACMRHLPAINYGMTFEGEAVSIAAALATVREILERNVCHALAEKGSFLQQEYARLAARFGVASRLAGPPARPHLAFDPDHGVSERELRCLFIQELARAGVLTIGVFNLCFSHDDEDLHSAVAACEGAMRVVGQALQRRSVAGLLDARVHRSISGQ